MSACRTNFLRLTRRANQGHVTIIADIVSPRRKPAAGFFVGGDAIRKDSFK
jgi:hypothetical protein